MSGTERKAAYWLSDDGMTLIVSRRAPGGIQTATYNRDRHAGPFTDADVDADVDLAIAGQPAATKTMQPGQRNKTRRITTRSGTLYLHVMTGPPTWWLPRMVREEDGTLMTGWLRLAAAVKFDCTLRAGE